MSLYGRCLHVCLSLTKFYSLSGITTSTSNVARIADKFHFGKVSSITRYLSISKCLENKPKDEADAGLHITDACVKQLKKVANADEFLRVSVEGGGCSGFSYKFTLDKELQDDDICFDQDGARVVSDQVSLEMIKGSTVDYEEELIKSAFSVKDNPRSSMKCSCGVSFALD